MSSRTFIPILLFALLAIHTPAHANTTVALLTVQEQPAYTSSRVYAGRTVAGRVSELGFKLGGEVAEITVDIGDVVVKGALIGKLDTRRLEAALAQARANVELAAANLEAVDAETQLARQTEQRFRTLREAGHTSAQLYDEQRLAFRAKIAQRNVARANLNSAKAGQLSAEIIIEEAHVYAPFNGTIQARHVDEGSQTTPGAPNRPIDESATTAPSPAPTRSPPYNKLTPRSLRPSRDAIANPPKKNGSVNAE